MVVAFECGAASNSSRKYPLALTLSTAYYVTDHASVMFEWLCQMLENVHLCMVSNIFFGYGRKGEGGHLGDGRTPDVRWGGANIMESSDKGPTRERRAISIVGCDSVVSSCI